MTGLVSRQVAYNTDVAAGGRLWHPQGVSVHDGVVYVSNTGSHVVTAVHYGEVTIIAGSLTEYGLHGDGGKATSASLFRPTGTAVNTNGDVYIADSGDNAIRKASANGTIHRIAGTGDAGSKLAPDSAVNSLLNNPHGVAIIPDGGLLIADTNNNRVLAVTRAGKISVVAGIGTAGYRGDNGPAASAALNHPTGVAADSEGNIYIVDASNNVVRRVAAETRTITTVAGNYAASTNDGLGGYSGDGGPATAAQLNAPHDVAIDGSGNLFIADTFNNVIRHVTPDGKISTVGTAAGPIAVAVDSDNGSVYLVDAPGNTISHLVQARVLYDFEDGTAQGWQPGTGVSSVAAVTTTLQAPKTPYEGQYVLEATANRVPAGDLKSIAIDLDAPLDLSGQASLFSAINTYGGAAQGLNRYEATITLSSGSHTLTQTSPISANGWRQASIDISSWQNSGSITRIEIGIRGLGSNTLWAPRFHIDQVACTDVSDSVNAPGNPTSE